MKLIKGINVYLSIILILGTIASCFGELRLLLSVYRHGDRYPMGHKIIKLIYPLNPNINVSWFPDAEEGLTMEGKRRSFELGKAFRRRYGDWFGTIYSNDFVEFRSSHKERTIVTSSLVAAGLFPPRDSQRWNSHLNWQPIPIKPVPRGKKILFFGAFCSKYKALLNDTKSRDPLIIKYDAYMQEFYDYVSRNTGGPISNQIINYLYLELLAASSGGLAAPKWAEDIFPEGKLKEAALVEYQFSSWTDELKRYTGGVWIKEWLDFVNSYLMADSKNSTKKALLYCGHDVNIAGIMITLGIFDRRLPNYTSAINFELHEDENQHFYVKVLYRDSNEFIEKLIPGCGNTLCPLETFKHIFAKFASQNETLECGDNLQY